MKKAKIFVENGQTVIELSLNFDRAWSSVQKLWMHQILY